MNINYQKKYLKYKIKYFDLKNKNHQKILLNGGGIEDIIDNVAGVDILRPLFNNNPNRIQYYNEIQRTDGLCQLFAVNNFIGQHTYNSVNMMIYLTNYIYPNLKKIHDIIVYLETLVNDLVQFEAEEKSLNYFRMLVDLVKIMYNQYLIDKDNVSLTIIDKVINIIKETDFNIILTTDTKSDIITNTVLFLLMFRVIDNNLYFYPIITLNLANYYQEFEMKKIIKNNDIKQIFLNNNVNKFIIGDIFRNHTYVCHITTTNENIKVDSLLSHHLAKPGINNVHDTNISVLQETLVTFPGNIYTFILNTEEHRLLINSDDDNYELLQNEMCGSYMTKLSEIISEIFIFDDEIDNDDASDFDF